MVDGPPAAPLTSALAVVLITLLLMPANADTKKAASPSPKAAPQKAASAPAAHATPIPAPAPVKAPAPVATTKSPTPPAPASFTTTIGSYKGVPITPGTDAQVAAQIAKINAASAPAQAALKPVAQPAAGSSATPTATVATKTTSQPLPTAAQPSGAAPGSASTTSKATPGLTAVTLGNGDLVYVDHSGAYYDKNGKSVAATAVAAAKAGSPSIYGTSGNGTSAPPATTIKTTAISTPIALPSPSSAGSAGASVSATSTGSASASTGTGATQPPSSNAGVTETKTGPATSQVFTASIQPVTTAQPKPATDQSGTKAPTSTLPTSPATNSGGVYTGATPVQMAALASAGISVAQWNSASVAQQHTWLNSTDVQNTLSVIQPSKVGTPTPLPIHPENTGAASPDTAPKTFTATIPSASASSKTQASVKDSSTASAGSASLPTNGSVYAGVTPLQMGALATAGIGVAQWNAATAAQRQALLNSPNVENALKTIQPGTNPTPSTADTKSTGGTPGSSASNAATGAVVPSKPTTTPQDFSVASASAAPAQSNKAGTPEGTLKLQTANNGQITLTSYSNGLNQGTQNGNYQCVTLIHDYATKLGFNNTNMGPDGAHAAQYFANASGGQFHYVANGGADLPAVGSVISIAGWPANKPITSGDEAGHVGIAQSVQLNTADRATVTLFDQNFPGGKWLTVNFQKQDGVWTGFINDDPHGTSFKVPVQGWANPT